MNVDHYFAIGSAHQAQGRPCEDYALSGVRSDGLCYGVVTDGCSGVNAHTDIGARVLAWAFEAAFNQMPRADEHWLQASFDVALMDAFGRRCTASLQDYFATLVGFVASPQTVKVLVHGDGAVALRYADGRMALVELQWENSMPLYLNYRSDPHALTAFLSQQGAQAYQETTTVFRPDNGDIKVLSRTITPFATQDLLQGRVLEFAPEREGIVALAVLTDGYAQVGAQSATNVARTFLDFKTHRGEFVKRRLLRALKDFRKLEVLPQDDVGIAAVWFEEPSANTAELPS